MEDKAAQRAVEGEKRSPKVDISTDGENSHSSERKPLVIIESPYSGDVAANEAYARKCMADSLRRGESPLLSHLLYTQVLHDTWQPDRELGIEAGLAWYRVAEKCVVYADRGMSKGMSQGVERAQLHGVRVEARYIEQGQSVRRAAA